MTTDLLLVLKNPTILAGFLSVQILKISAATHSHPPQP